MSLDTRKTIIVDGATSAVELAEWLVGSVWSGQEYDDLLRSGDGGEAYLFVAPHIVHPEAEVDAPVVLRAAYVAAHVDMARSLRRIADGLEELVDAGWDGDKPRMVS